MRKSANLQKVHKRFKPRTFVVSVSSQKQQKMNEILIRETRRVVVFRNNTAAESFVDADATLR